MAHLQADRLTEARSLLIAYIREHPDTDRAWYLLSLAVTEPAKQIECLDRALRLNPANGPARERLANLLVLPGTPAASSVAQMAPPKAAPPPAAAPTPAATTSTPAPRPKVASSAPALTRATRARDPSPKPEPTNSVQSLREQLANASPAASTEPRQAAAARRPPRWGLLAIIGLLVIVLAAMVAFGGRYVLFALNPPRPVVVVPLVTPITYPTLPPTWTPTPLPSPTPIPSATGTPTLTPSPTFEPPDATQAAEMDKIDQQVADLRGLTIEASNPRFLIPRPNVEQALRSQLVSPGLIQQLDNEKITFSALGLIKPTYDLVRYELNANTDAFGGFYIPWTKQMWVIGSQFTGIERFVYSHEFDHALTDQHFHISDMGVYPTCTSNGQRCEAIRALVEGDATLLMGQWWRQYATPKDYQDIANYKPPSQTLPEEFSPPWVSQDLNFPYKQGLAFVQDLYRRGNWAAVNKAYANLPASTEQILHIDKYLAREAPITVPDPALTNTLGADWRSVSDDVLGEWTTYLLLGYGADVSAQLDDATAQKAAQGWGGDHYQAFYNDKTQQTVLAAHWVWDTAADAREYATAMRQYLDLRFRGGKVDRADGACWEANGQASCIFSPTAGDETLWLLAPNQTVLNQVLAAFPAFHS